MPFALVARAAWPAAGRGDGGSLAFSAGVLRLRADSGTASAVSTRRLGAAVACVQPDILCLIGGGGGGPMAPRALAPASDSSFKLGGLAILDGIGRAVGLLAGCCRCGAWRVSGAKGGGRRAQNALPGARGASP